MKEIIPEYRYENGFYRQQIIHFSGAITIVFIVLFILSFRSDGPLSSVIGNYLLFPVPIYFINIIVVRHSRPVNIFRLLLFLNAIATTTYFYFAFLTLRHPFSLNLNNLLLIWINLIIDALALIIICFTSFICTLTFHKLIQTKQMNIK